MLPMPGNGEEGAYTANAMLSVLLDLLVQKKVIESGRCRHPDAAGHPNIVRTE
jgi:hypothetical protein